jgi:hypothetical protein
MARRGVRCFSPATISIEIVAVLSPRLANHRLTSNSNVFALKVVLGACSDECFWILWPR